MPTATPAIPSRRAARRSTLGALAIPLLLLAACAAPAREAELRVHPDGEVRARSYAAWQRNACQPPSPPVVEVLRSPAHGTLELRPVPVELRGPGGRSTNTCYGQSAEGTGVWYRPDPGYRGEDRFELRVVRANGQGARDAFAVAVR